jgi:hypothetical protein
MSAIAKFPSPEPDMAIPVAKALQWRVTIRHGVGDDHQHIIKAKSKA